MKAKKIKQSMVGKYEMKINREEKKLALLYHMQAIQFVGEKLLYFFFLSRREYSKKYQHTVDLSQFSHFLCEQSKLSHVE